MRLDDIKQLLASRLGIEQLNPMQTEVINSKESNMVLLAPTGSGKTVAFSTAMLMSMTSGGHGKVAGVVIAPSRELVLQIYRVVRELAKDYKVVALYGGHSMSDEKNSLTPVPDIIIATPGRLLDHVSRSNISLTDVKVLVLDEYDKALELGFVDEMKKIVRRMPNLKRTLLISATRLTDIPDFMSNKVGVTINYLNDKEYGPRQRTQIVEVESPVPDKVETLYDLLLSLDNGKALVFVNHRESATRLYELLKKKGFPVGVYHGALEQSDREKAIDLFNNGTTPILVSTDLGARGLDIDDVQYVIHYHIPLTVESWTHRNGRTARQQACGTVYVISSDKDNRPEFLAVDRKYVPNRQSDNPIRSTVATIHFNAGKKEKLSRGDIAGYLIKQCGLSPEQVGKIVVRDHNAIVAVPAESVGQILKVSQTEKIKGKKPKITRM